MVKHGKEEGMHEPVPRIEFAALVDPSDLTTEGGSIGVMKFLMAEDLVRDLWRLIHAPVGDTEHLTTSVASE